MIINTKKQGSLIDGHKQKVLVQIGRRFYSLQNEFRIEVEKSDSEIARDLKMILDQRDVRLLKED